MRNRKTTFKRVSVVLAVLVGSVAYLSLLEAAGARLAVVDAGVEGGASYITGSGTTNYLAKFTSATTIGNTGIFENAGNVGIGTTIPSQKLEVNGGVRLNATAPKPTCNSAARGTFWFNRSDDLGDSVEACKVTGSVSVRPETIAPLIGHVSCAVNTATNKTYCFGSWYPSSNRIVEYDPSTGSVVAKNAVFPASEFAFSSCVENSSTHKIYCLGGRVGGSRSNKIFEYDPASDTLVQKNALLSPERENSACAERSSTNKIYCFGGFSNGGQLNVITEYDPATDTAVNKSATMPAPQYWGSCVGYPPNGKIYCFSGTLGSGFLQTILEYDAAIDTLVTKGATIATGFGLSCARNTLNDKIYCFGGYKGAVSKDINEYTPGSDTNVKLGATLPSGRYGLGCVEYAPTHKTYCFGGDLNGSYTQEITVYPELSHSWVKID